MKMKVNVYKIFEGSVLYIVNSVNGSFYCYIIIVFFFRKYI